MLQLLDNVADCNTDKIVTGVFGCLQQAFQKQLCEMDKARGKFPHIWNFRTVVATVTRTVGLQTPAFYRLRPANKTDH